MVMNIDAGNVSGGGDAGDGVNGTDTPYSRPMYNGAHAAISVANHARDQGYKLKFTHIGTGHSVEFPAVMQAFSDSHKAEIQQRVFPDFPNPYITQGSTGRDISFTFTVLNASIAEARYNERSINMLIQFLYPRLNASGRTSFNPYIKIEQFSLLDDGTGATECIIQNISYELNIEEGLITPTKYEAYPISINIAVSAVAIIPSSEGDDDATPYNPNYPRYVGS